MKMLLSLTLLRPQRLTSVGMPVVVITCLALVTPLPPAHGKGGFKCSAGKISLFKISMLFWDFLPLIKTKQDPRSYIIQGVPKKRFLAR